MHSVGDASGSRTELLITCTGETIGILPPRERVTGEDFSDSASVRTRGPFPCDDTHSVCDVTPPLPDVRNIYDVGLLVGLAPRGYTNDAAFADIVSMECARDLAFALCDGAIHPGGELSRTHTEICNTPTCTHMDRSPTRGASSAGSYTPQSVR